ncbi:calsyntenin-1 isoform X2 [Teleopsis dalmanni]|uniref:calsyntenin-1 isoform X2 n=1 Tax=Teleopsis dalmanni TaxID=139649 RepID=UPI0018CE5A8C|nr:calsyntenin-1 isoform X2 [Teleopsis dalmanni]
MINYLLDKMNILLLLWLVLNICNATGSSANFRYLQPTLTENDDDYLLPKENVLEKSYHGLIRENETLVEITPLIKVDEEKICNFRIVKKPYHEIPFQIAMVNNLGIIKARRTLNCERRKSYHFEIIALFCDGTHSASSNVHITVVDINEYSPTFIQPSYVIEVEEGKLYKEIIRVEAIDKDCTPIFGDVCKYEILNNDQPFIIDNEGSIRNIEPLSHKVSHNHILSVVAYDCAMKESSPIMVSIKVKRVCEAKFLGIPERIDYTTSTTEILPLFPNAHLDLCDLNCNDIDIDIHMSIALKTKHISFGCDRDLTNCSNDVSLVDLLPKGVEWTKELSYDEGLEPLFQFDGASGVIIPITSVAQHDFSAQPFSIVTIFRHYSLSTQNKHSKEHIICSADDHKMNRHHMALFIRNCRLILLLRRNFNDGNLNIFSPAEWRWKIPQVCDNEWHHYILNVDPSKAKIELFIDGTHFETAIEDRHTNPEVIDDWPLHAAHGVNTTLAVGACYQSSENRLKHGFIGDISEIKLSLNSVLSTDDIKCGTNCAEHLVPPPESLLEADSQVQTNAQLNEIYIEGHNKMNVEKLIQRIHYINTKEYPTIGRRNIELHTTVTCFNQTSIRLPTVETYIMVNEPSPISPINSINEINNITTIGVNTSPKKETTKKHDVILDAKNSMLGVVNTEKSRLIISGNNNNLVSYPEIKSGVHILGHINITVAKLSQIELELQKLDSCSVVVFPSLNPDHEEIQVDGDESLSSTLDIKTNINKDGVEMIGKDTITNYMDVLKALVYSNKKPAYYLNRVFKLTCIQITSEYKSAEYTLTLTVLHPKQSVVKSTYSPVIVDRTLYEPNLIKPNPVTTSSDNIAFAHAMVHTHDVQEPRSKIHSIVYKGSHPTVLIILICVFLVVLLCGISIARLKNNSNHKYAGRDQPCPKIADESLVWDDSALTITINPMQTDALSEDSSDSENSETDDEEVVKGGFSNVNQLEWDNTSMFTSNVN